MTTPDPDQVRQITKDVLARPEFQTTTSWTQLLTDHVWDWLRQLAQWSARNPNLSKVAIITLSVILLGLIAHIVYTAVSEFITVRNRDALSQRRQPLAALDGVAENWSEAFTLAKASLE